MISGYLANTNRTTATAIVSNDASSTAGPDDNPFQVISRTSHETDALLLEMIQFLKKAEEELRMPIKPKFDRVMKMRNTDGRPVQYSTWKPVRMLCGRDNIGTRNFKKLN